MSKPEKETLEYYDPNVLVIIGLDTAHRENHPLFDERVFNPVDDALVKNIITYGITQPVNVRQEEGKLLVIDGRQRVRAAREAAKRLAGAGEHGIKVPVRITRGDDGRVMGIMVSNNELRQNDDILTKARKAERLLAQVGDMNEVAIAFGRTTVTIKNWLSLLEADEVIHDAIQSDKISAAAGVELSFFPKSEQAEKLALLLNANGKSIGVTSNEGLIQTEEEVPPEAAKTKAGKVSIAQVKELKSGVTRKRNWSGVSRMWLKKALKTEIAASLSPKRKAILQWFVTSEAEGNDWFVQFAKDAANELKKKEKRGKNKKARIAAALAKAAEAEANGTAGGDDEALVDSLPDGDGVDPEGVDPEGVDPDDDDDDDDDSEESDEVEAAAEVEAEAEAQAEAGPPEV